MWKFIAWTFFQFVIVSGVLAQSAANYSFSTNTNGSLSLDMNSNAVDMTTGTTLLIGPNVNTFATSATPIGFDFWLMGTRNTSFNASSHGLLGLTTLITTGNNVGGGAGPRLGAFVNGTTGTNMATSATGKVHYKIVGTAPNRTLVVEWLNMSINSSSTSADATFQVRLYETSNAIEFVYGSMNISTGGPFTTVRAGFSTNTGANTFSTIAFGSHTAITTTGTDNTVSNGVVTSLNSAVDGNRRFYRFIPNSTNAPSGINFTGVTASSINVNWQDNATDELGYALLRSDDGGVSYALQTITAPNTTNFAVTGLLANTSYFFRVHAIREALSAPLVGNQSTLTTTAASTTGSGLWSAPSTWSTGAVPDQSSVVTIGAGHTVTIDVAASAYSVDINGTLEFEQTTARALTVGESVNINAGGVFQSNPAGTQTSHSVSIGRNLINRGTLDFSTNTNTAGAAISFNTTNPGAFTLDASATTDLRSVVINKGTTSAQQMIFTPGGTFTVLGANTAGFLGFGTGGTFEIAGTNTFSSPVFATAGYSIPLACAFRLNNPNATVLGQAGSPTNNGQLRISQGTFNIGTAADNAMGAGAGASFVIEGGILNIAGRLNTANAITYTQSGGVVNVCTVGSTGSATPSFGITAAGSSFNMSGGIINLVQRTSGATQLDYNVAGVSNITGGTLQIGTSATAANSNFIIQGNTPSLVIDNTTNNKNLLLSAATNVFGNVTVNAGTTLNAQTSTLSLWGNAGAVGNLINNGTITNTSATGTNRLQFSSSFGVQTYSGTGIMGTPALAFAGINVANPAGVTFSGTAANTVVTRMNLISGQVTNATNITVGFGAASAPVIQVGGNAATNAGSFDGPPTFNIGTGGLTLVYANALNAVTTSHEIPATRIIGALSIGNTNGVTLAGGPLTVTEAAGLTLTSGILSTSNANLLTIASTVTGAVSGGSSTSYVNGPLARTLPASLATGSTYAFPVGKSSSGLFELVNPTTNAGGTVVVRVESFDGSSGGTAGTGMLALLNNRYWSSDLTSGAANFINGTVRVTDATISLGGGNRLAQSATQTGAYNNIGNVISGVTIASASPLTSLGFFAIGFTNQVLAGGTYTLGNSAPTYQKLTQVASALGTSVITGDIVFELLPDYDGTTGETFPINFVPISKSGGNWKVTIRPQAGVTNRITAGDPGTGNALIVLDGVDSLSFDGRPGGVGTTSQWLFRNTRTAATVGSVFVFQNGATNDTLQFLSIEGQNTAAAQASVLFGTTTVGVGNSNNTLRSNDIRNRSDVAGVPHTLVASAGTAAAPNNNNQLIANTLRNFTGNGLSVSANSNNWIVGGTTAAEGNNVYQEVARTTAFNHISLTTGNNHLVGYNNIYQTSGVNTGGAVNCIQVTGGGSGHIIRNNSIGGSNANRTGTGLLLNTGSTINGIIITAGTNSASEVYNNTISNYGNIFLTGTLGIANGILVNGGNVNIGRLGGNTLGGAVVSGVASDTLVTNYDNGWINVQGGTCIVENNLISNAAYYRLANDRNAGITVGGGSGHIIRNNTIRAIKGNNQTALPTAFTLAGIFCSVSGTSIVGNTIDDIQNFNSSAFAGPSALGINWTAAAGTITRNRITNVSGTGVQTGTAAPLAYGIFYSTGNVNISNNQISIGANSANESRVAGIVSSGATNPGGVTSYNTIYISGANTSGGNNSYGILRTNTSGVTYLNNIVYNARTGGTGRHYAIGNTASTPTTNFTGNSANYNLYVTSDPNSVGEWGAATNRDFAQWKTSSLADTSSYSVTSTILPVSRLFENPAAGNLNIVTANPESWYANGKAIAGATSGNVINDFAGDSRGITLGTPTDIGSDEFTPDTGVLPPDATPSAAPAPSTTTTYTFGGRRIGEIVWGANGTVPSAISWKYYSGLQPLPGAINSHHDVQATGGSGYTYDFKQYYTLAEQNQIPDAALQGIKRTIPAAWQDLGGSFATEAAGRFVTSTGLNGFSLFSLAPTGIIPVKLEYFRGTKQGNSHVLDWKLTPVNTAQARITLERSSDGRNFTALHIITASAVRMLQPFNYSTNNLLSGTNYYRLKITDDHGVTTYSSMVALMNTSKGFELVNITPNPVISNQFKLNITTAESLHIEIVVTDLAGRVVSRQINKLISGFNAIDVKVQNLAKGMYQVTGIIDGERTQTLKLVKQ